MIINKQNLLNAGACVEGSDDAETICNFPCEYSTAITLCRDADRNDLAAWMLFFKANVIQTIPGWTTTNYKVKNPTTTEWELADTIEQFESVKQSIRQQEMEANIALFSVNKITYVNELEVVTPVDITTETEDGTYDVFSYSTGQYTRTTSLAEARQLRSDIQSTYMSAITLEIQIKVLSEDQSETAWGKLST